MTTVDEDIGLLFSVLCMRVSKWQFPKSEKVGLGKDTFYDYVFDCTFHYNCCWWLSWWCPFLCLSWGKHYRYLLSLLLLFIFLCLSNFYVRSYDMVTHCTLYYLSWYCLLFFLVWKDSKKLQQLYFDPCQRLVADCILMDVNTAVVSDRKGSIAVLSCADYLEGKRLNFLWNCKSMSANLFVFQLKSCKTQLRVGTEAAGCATEKSFIEINIGLSVYLL